MKLKKIKPTSPGRRHQLILEKSILSKSSSILKSHIKGFKNASGHSTQTGRITVRHKGSGCKNKYRVICNQNKNCNNIFIIISILYDPNRTSYIALRFNLILYTFDFILYTKYTSIGTLLENKKNFEEDYIKIGSRLQIKKIPTGALIHSVSKNNKIIYSKSAGTYCQIIQKFINKCKLKLPSGNVILIKTNAYATIGTIANEYKKLIVLGKAGRARKLNNRPSVRGVAMNPVDHPHGGRTNGGRPCVSPWGKLTRGVPTTKKKYV